MCLSPTIIVFKMKKESYYELDDDYDERMIKTNCELNRILNSGG